MSTLSLIVPSGQLALGESARRDPPLGADQRSTDTLYGAADLHALTAEHGPRLVRAVTLDQAALRMAADLDPAGARCFVPRHVPAHAELYWLPEASAYDR